MRTLREQDLPNPALNVTAFSEDSLTDSLPEGLLPAAIRHISAAKPKWPLRLPCLHGKTRTGHED